MTETHASWMSVIPVLERGKVDGRLEADATSLGSNPALLVIDVSYGFTGDRSEPILDSIARWPQSCGSDAWDTMPTLQRLIDAAREGGRPVIYSTGEYRSDGWDYGSWLWKVSTVGGPPRPDTNRDPMQIVDEIAPQPDDLVIRKRKPSAFYGTPLTIQLTCAGIDSLIVCGTTTSGCVRATVSDAVSLGYRTVVVADGCFDRAQTSHAVALFDMARLFGPVISADNACALLGATRQ
jgi:maleamate amidohydrolase